MLKGIHHVAFAEEAGAALVARLVEVFDLEVESVETAADFVERMLPVGDCRLQALEATCDGVVRQSIAKRGPGLHHVAFEVEDLDAALERMKRLGVELIDGEPRIGGGGHRIAFAHPRAFGGVLVELVELTSHRASAEENRP